MTTVVYTPFYSPGALEQRIRRGEPVNSCPSLWSPLLSIRGDEKLLRLLSAGVRSSTLPALGPWEVRYRSALAGSGLQNRHRPLEG